MSKFKKKGKRGLPPINTAALPDIVFMLLFFFMVTTVVREAMPLVQYVIPETTYSELIEDRSKIGYIYVGTLEEGELGDGTQIELNGQIMASTVQLENEVGKKWNSLDEQKKEDYKFALKIDNEAQMREVIRIKRALQKNEALEIIYISVTEENM